MVYESTTIPVKPETHMDVRRLKRGGESWDSLIRKMAAQYDPNEATQEPQLAD